MDLINALGPLWPNRYHCGTVSSPGWSLSQQDICHVDIEAGVTVKQGQWLPGYRSIDITGNNTSVVRLWPHDHTPTWHVPRWFRSMQFTLVLSVTYLVGSWSGHTSPAAVQSKLYSQWVTGPFHSSWKKNKKNPEKHILKDCYIIRCGTYYPTTLC